MQRWTISVRIASKQATPPPISPRVRPKLDGGRPSAASYPGSPGKTATRLQKKRSIRTTNIECKLLLFSRRGVRGMIVFLRSGNGSRCSCLSFGVFHAGPCYCSRFSCMRSFYDPALRNFQSTIVTSLYATLVTSTHRRTPAGRRRLCIVMRAYREGVLSTGDLV